MVEQQSLQLPCAVLVNASYPIDALTLHFSLRSISALYCMLIQHLLLFTERISIRVNHHYGFFNMHCQRVCSDCVQAVCNHIHPNGSWALLRINLVHLSIFFCGEGSLILSLLPLLPLLQCSVPSLLHQCFFLHWTSINHMSLYKDGHKKSSHCCCYYLLRKLSVGN